MENIVIIDAWSSGVYFLDDIIYRGFHPVVLWTHRSDYVYQETAHLRARVEARFQNRADFLTEDEDYATTLSKVKALNPRVVLPGSDLAVELATCLIEDLGLPGNGRALIPNMTNKLAMQDALIKAGLRGIRSKIVHDWEEAIHFYREEGLSGCVLKPYRGGGSLMVRVCNDEQDLKAAFDEVFEGGNFLDGSEQGMLLQERIVGTEHIVNTVSYDGHHKMTGMWRYNKKKVSGGGMAYNYDETLSRPETGCYELARYAFGTLDALGIKYGNVHGEFMIDDKGPVLIEVNCRPMGEVPVQFADRVWGHHETDLVLDAFLNPSAFLAHVNDPYRPLAKGFSKDLIAYSDTDFIASPILAHIRHLPSFCQADLAQALGDRLERTIDLETSAGTVYLVNEDEAQLLRDITLLERMENDYFDMFFATKRPRAADAPANIQSVCDVLAELRPTGSVLLCSDETTTLPGTMSVSTDDLAKASDGFANGILDLPFAEDEDPEVMIDLFFLLMSKVRKGGRIMVPERTYWHFPCGIASIELLAEVSGLFVEAPTAVPCKTLVIEVS